LEKGRAKLVQRSRLGLSMENERDAAERFYRDLVEHSLIGVLVCDTDGQIELANTVLAGIIGRPPAEIIGTNLRDLFLPDQQIPWETWRQESPDPMRQPAVLRMHGPDGRSLTVECHGRAIQLPLTGQEDTDDLARIHLVIQDVTTQHRRLHELQLLLDLTHLVSVQENIDAAFQIVAQRPRPGLSHRRHRPGKPRSDAF
jgi:PAS domain S-box-containing protein